MKNFTWVVCVFLLSQGLARAEDPGKQPALTIPLQSVYSTSGQAGLHPPASLSALDWVDPMSGQAGLQYLKPGDKTKVRPNPPGKGPAIVGFGWAKDFQQLVKSRLISPLAAGGDLALLRTGDPDGQLWVVVYIGSTGSQPPQWLLDSVTLSHDNVWKVVYHHAPLGTMTTLDIYPYVAWIPLGKPAGEASRSKLQLIVDGKLAAEQAWSVKQTAGPTTPASVPAQPNLR